MNASKRGTIFWLTIRVCCLVWFNAGMGLLYSDGGKTRVVENIYGQTIELFGDGVYANNSMLRATTAKGSDLVMLLVSMALFAAAFRRSTSPKAKLIHAGLLVPILYYSATTAFGVAFGRMFLAYVALFSVVLYAFIVTMIDLVATVKPAAMDRKYTKTAVFTMLSGCTVMVWLMSILPTLFTSAPLDIIEISTTEPTFIIDIGIIFPTCLYGGVMLLKKKPMGYILPPIMLTFLSVIAATVLGQTAVQLRYGVVVSIEQVVGYVGSFVIFGIIAAIVNLRFLKLRKKDEQNAENKF
jgi:hypothetical protein